MPLLPSDRTGSASVSWLAIVAAVVLVIVWLGAAGLWAVATLMGGAMANDAGRVAADRHATLLLLLFAGEALVALAGPVGAAAIVLPDHRSLLGWGFAGLTVVGIAAQVAAAWAFSAAAR